MATPITADMVKKLRDATGAGIGNPSGTAREGAFVEQLQGYQGEEVASYLFHAFGTNLQFDEGEFNFVKARSEHGTKRAFEMCKEHFEVPER